MPFGDFEIPDTDAGRWYKQVSTKNRGTHVMYDIKSARNMVENDTVKVRKEIRTTRKNKETGEDEIIIKYQDEVKRYTYLELVPNFLHPQTLMSKLNAKSIEKTLAKKKTTLEELIPVIVAGMVLCSIIAVVYFLTQMPHTVQPMIDTVPTLVTPLPTVRPL
jgi:translation initiation factor IF-2